MDLQRPFTRITELLQANLDLIKYRPFRHILNPPVLTDTARSLLDHFANIDDDTLAVLEQNQDAYDAFVQRSAPHLWDQLASIRQLEHQWQVQPPQTTTDGPTMAPFRFLKMGIPGRKWQQINRFAESTKVDSPVLVDWCSGKGHLARLLKLTNPETKVHCLEYDAELCQAGAQLNSSPQTTVEFHHQDVLQPLPSRLNGDNCHHTALHACGDLHVALLRHAAEHRVSGLSLSPCCYHKTRDEAYRALSEQGLKAALPLTRDDISLAVSETVTGGNRAKRQRHQERLWRNAFDLLQRDLRSESTYLPVPSCPKSILSGSYEGFVSWCCEQKQLSLPANLEISQYLERAADLTLRIRKQELAHQMFKRPLELWLVLDRALYLENHGYQCELKVFCRRNDSPRNLLISASLPV